MNVSRALQASPKRGGGEGFILLSYTRLNSSNTPYLRAAFRLSCVSLNSLFDFFYIFEWPGFPSLNRNLQSISKPIEQSPGK